MFFGPDYVAVTKTEEKYALPRVAVPALSTRGLAYRTGETAYACCCGAPCEGSSRRGEHRVTLARVRSEWAVLKPQIFSVIQEFYISKQV